MLLASVVLPPVIDSVSLEALQLLWRMKWDLLRLPFKSLNEQKKSFHAVILALTSSLGLHLQGCWTLVAGFHPIQACNKSYEC